jgi:hypothetical protein
MSLINHVLLWPILLNTAVSPAFAQDLPKKYIGESDCTRELDSALCRYGVRLDRAQEAYLTTYRFKEAEIITIVQHHGTDSGNKRCGVISDVTEVKDKDASVVWDCMDRRAPAQVVVGTWPAKYPKLEGPAIEAWEIDLQELKFVPVKEPHRFVFCRNESRAGNDDGLGLSDLAKKRTSK